jgi:hypothetical protein
LQLFPQLGGQREPFIRNVRLSCNNAARCRDVTRSVWNYIEAGILSGPSCRNFMSRASVSSIDKYDERDNKRDESRGTGDNRLGFYAREQREPLRPLDHRRVAGGSK